MTVSKGYQGFFNDGELPFKQEQRIKIPKGTPVSTMHPSKSDFITSRTMTVKVDHLLPGRSIPAYMALRDKDWRRYLEKTGFDFAGLERLYEEDHGKFCETYVPVENPKVRWPGSGGYWNAVDINFLLEANGLPLGPVTSDDASIETVENENVELSAEASPAP